MLRCEDCKISESDADAADEVLATCPHCERLLCSRCLDKHMGGKESDE